MSAKLSFVLNEDQTGLLESLSSQLDTSGLLWASGYLAGLAASHQPMTDAAAPVPNSPTVAIPRLTVLYGSQTGNAKRLAEELADQAGAAGLDVRLVRADDYSVKELKKEKFLYVVISTHSSGDVAQPPDDSVEFMERLLSKRAPKTDGLSFGVLALGDTSYPDFCGVGRDVDKRLEELGGKRLLERGETDVDIETVADPWMEQALAEAKKLQAEAAPAAQPSAVVTPLHASGAAQWTRKTPFAAEILTNQRIVASNSERDIRHLELSLEDSGITYQPGDALGVWPVQSQVLVQAVLDTLGLDGSTDVTIQSETHSLADWLTHYRELTCLTRPFIQAQAERGNHQELLALLEKDRLNELAQLLNRVQLIDFLRDWPTDWTAEALVASLRPLAPRMYSVASSQQEVDDEVHLTVELLHYQSHDQDRFGVATRYLCDLEEGETAPVFLDPNDRFRLPADDSTDIIMIGPGTGIAPFRAFVQERAERGGEGRNWLFFGNRHMRRDFLYQVEWQKALQKGDLQRLDVAFSRDQQEKVYVQDRIREQAQELWTWLDGGAHLYLCGDADRMAPDVQQALTEMAVEQGGKTTAEAEAWLKGLLSDGRFARDVY